MRNDGRIVRSDLDSMAIQELLDLGISREAVSRMRDGSIMVRPNQRWFQLETETVWLMAMVDLTELEKRNFA